PSTGAVTGFYTENQSWGLAAVEMARLRRDTWRLRGLITHAEVNYDFYGIGEAAGEAGLSVALAQTMDFAVGSAHYRLKPGLYGGLSLTWIHTRAALQDDHGLANPPGDEDLATANLLAPGLQAEFDTRDDDYWPTRGSIAVARASFFSTGLGSARDFQRYMATWSWYSTLRGPALVLATNLNAARAAGDVPFWAIPSVGAGRYGLRGYTQGRYRDGLVTTAQAELRAHTAGRWGATVFGGLAQVAPDVGGLGSARGLPAGGAGARFQLARRYPMHMRADYAWGRNGGLFYFSVVEAF
ncbi:MAG TPA: BamA/TamA family outer membrane protein, partial [Candidatus Eisenbacteria bacterium]